MRFAARMGASDFVDCVSTRMGANIVFILLCVFLCFSVFRSRKKQCRQSALPVYTFLNCGFWKQKRENKKKRGI